MKRIIGAALLAAACGVLVVGARADDPPAKKDDKKADAPKKGDTKAKALAKEEVTYNAPPKGQALHRLPTVKGKVTKACDGKVFGFQADNDKKDVEVNLAATTRIEVVRKDDFDEKGNPKRNPRRGPVKGTADDIKAGAAVVELSATRGGWYVARRVLLLGEGE